MKTIVLTLCAFVVLCSCSKKTDDPMPETKKVVILLSVVYDATKPTSEDVEVVLTRGARIDTLLLSNYPGTFLMVTPGDENEISISSLYGLNATVKKDDGTTLKTNVYKEYVNEKYISFKISDL